MAEYFLKEKEYISREAFITRQRELYCQNCDRRRGMKDGKLTKRFVYPIGGAPCRACDVDDMINAVEDYPAADAMPVRHGRWIDMGDFISCSLCSATRMKEFLCDYGVARRLDARTNYCPNCGARMDGDGE